MGVKDLALWLETSADSSFDEADVGNGNTINKWNDLKKSAVAFSVAKVGAGPIYSNTINSIPAVKFAGNSSDYLQISDASFLNNTDYTIFVLEKRLAAGTNYFLGSTSSNANDKLALGYASDSTVTHEQGSNVYSDPASVSGYSDSSGKARIFTFVQDSTYGKRTYINGTLTAQSSDTARLSGVTNLEIGKNYNGEIGEIAIFTRPLKGEERKAIEDYMGKKWTVKIIDRDTSPSCVGYTLTPSGCDLSSASCTISQAGVAGVVAATSSPLPISCSGRYTGTLSYTCISGTPNVIGTCACATPYSEVGCASCNYGAGYISDGSGGCIMGPPTNSSAPTISTATAPQIGAALTVTNGTWSGSPTSYTYQWHWGDTAAAISGATSASYTPTLTDAGHTLLCKVIASNGGGSSFAVSSNTTAAVGSPILDQLTATATAAYSTRRLKGAYAGNAMRVRRSSDNAEQDIGFASDGTLNQAALLSFVGSGSGYVSIWYDQVGGKNLTQTITAYQPTIAVSGAVYKIGGTPTLYHDLSNDGMGYGGSVYLNSNPLTVNVVTGSNSNNNGPRRAVQGSPNNWLIGPFENVSSWYAEGWNYNSANWPLTSLQVITVIQPLSAANTAWHNGASVAAGNNKGVPGRINTGAAGGNFGPLDGYVSEVIVFSTDITTTDRQKLENNQLDYY